MLTRFRTAVGELDGHRTQRSPASSTPNIVVDRAALFTPKTDQNPGVPEILAEAPHPLDAISDRANPVVHAASVRGFYPQNCLTYGVANGIRGGVIGAAVGVAFAIANGPQVSAPVGTSAASYVGQAALRNAGGFAAWTGLYGFSRCQLVKIRRTNDILNPALAGGFTGAVLSLAMIPRSHWRYSVNHVGRSAAGSALFAVVFQAIYYI